MNCFLFFFRLIKSHQVKYKARKIKNQIACADWKKIVNFDSKYNLFITNNLGGGVAKFTQNYLVPLNHILILKNITYGQDWVYILENNDTHLCCCIDFNGINELFSTYIINKIIVNSLVTNKNTLKFLSLVVKSNIPVTVMVHDYYLVCPNYVLFSHNEHCRLRYCGENQCLNNLNPFLIPTCSIYEWRLKWQELLLYADEIRCFSNASKNIVLQAYPRVSESKVTVIPHEVDYCCFTPISYKKTSMHIGIVGAITSKAKGSDVVKEFLNFIKRKDCYVSVIGTPFRFLRVTGKRIHYTGQYNQVELQEIIQKENVNCIFFPSVCAETFSYLVSEIIMMNLPVVCFDFGAQAEKIRKYDKGIVCKSRNPNDIYESIKQALQL